MDANTESNIRQLAIRIVNSIRQHPDQPASEQVDSLAESLRDVYELGATESGVSMEGVEEATKHILLSKTFWGAILGFVGMIAPKLGLHFGTDQQTALVSEIVSGLGTALAIYGRFKATKKIG